MTPDGLPVHSFRTLLADLATVARNTIITAINPNYPLTVVTRPTPMQQKAFDLLVHLAGRTNSILAAAHAASGLPVMVHLNGLARVRLK
jgi:hypothetical protein